MGLTLLTYKYLFNILTKKNTNLHQTTTLPMLKVRDPLTMTYKNGLSVNKTYLILPHL